MIIVTAIVEMSQGVESIDSQTSALREGAEMTGSRDWRTISSCNLALLLFLQPLSSVAHCSHFHPAGNWLILYCRKKVRHGWRPFPACLSWPWVGLCKTRPWSPVFEVILPKGNGECGAGRMKGAKKECMYTNAKRSPFQTPFNGCSFS